MAFKTVYKSLAKIEVYHSYFLDDGAQSFTSMNAATKELQLLTYDVSEYLDIVPTFATAKEMINHKLVFRKGTDHFSILNKVTESGNDVISDIFLAEELTLSFYIYHKDYRFYNYSSIPKEYGRLYHFSNTKPAAVSGSYTYMETAASAGLITTASRLSEAATRGVWYAIEQENKRQDPQIRLDKIFDVEGDELESTEGQLILNQAVIKEQSRGLIGIIQLRMKGDGGRDTVAIDTLDPENPVSLHLDPIPVFRIHFDNRKTIWRYIKRAENNFLETQSVKPLTKNGFIEIDPDVDFAAPLPVDINTYLFPNPRADTIRTVTDQDTNTTTTYSEIYI
ncbi:hypothetical protein ACFSTE_21675 [Aquimarina hainanensis]|uniref:Phage tail protein n=1 Tax=Aquimarina hainanensis TaxID=1578017 RepID=A0ABW5ND24_9FLAO